VAERRARLTGFDRIRAQRILKRRAPIARELRATGAPSSVFVETPSARTVAIAVAIGAGSRHELIGERGAAHLLEHLCFRGVPGAETSAALAQAMEGLGANANASTDRESTIFWIHVPRDAAHEAARLLGSVVFEPMLLSEHLGVERAIVIEEIRAYADDPSEQASTALDRALFGDTELGREIAGRIVDIRRLTHRSVRGFHRRTYRAERSALAIAGALSAEEARAIARSALSPLRRGGVRSAPRTVRTSLARRRSATSRRSAVDGVVATVRHGEQAQFAVGLPALRREDPDAPALEMLATILGDGSASRLFLELREERGLVYDISASAIDYADAGALVVSGGADPSRVPEALRLVAEAIRRLAREVPSPAEIERARAYLAGRLERAADDPRGLAEWHASQRVLRRAPQDLADLLAEIESVRPADLLRVARRIVRGGALRVGLSAPRPAIAAVRREARRGVLEVAPRRPSPSRSARLSA